MRSGGWVGGARVAPPRLLLAPADGPLDGLQHATPQGCHIG